MINGYQVWYQFGEKHRLDGPAFVDADGYQAWFRHGKIHRLNGPAVVYGDGSEEWWIDGINITHLSVHERLHHVHAALSRCTPLS